MWMATLTCTGVPTANGCCSMDTSEWAVGTTPTSAVRADGSELIDLTESGYSDGNSKWIAGGKGVLYQSDRDGYRSHGSWGAQNDIYMVMLDGEAYERFNYTKEETELAKEAEKADKQDKDSDSKDNKKKNKKDKKTKEKT